ncbi:FtsK/SpoIIIE domain-containing protein [Niallia sp. NCCP-28]|uniref:FtsK/SpoIIIE domain-containing protein n=1 Tax=Niallia sp. NCCP-28 TaxID=2934712 RepID=UPI0020896D32|nr:FtsK/SpoIIIE domain-containing protein [Niallia sp. NCCP-28]GKU81179.1 cell division protein FtsK [Niallia sp. NCCP-28]
MIFETVTSMLMGGLALQAHLSKNGVGNDSKKLNKIFALSGLNVKDGKQTLTTQLVKKRNYEWGTEYRYRIPLGRGFEDYLSKKKIIEAGINTRTVKLQIGDIKQLKLDRNIVQSIRSLYKRKLTERKEIELSYDGMLIIRVYDEPMPTLVEMFEGKGWSVPIGITREKNKAIFHDFERIPHFALGGATRYGKSNLINGIITSLIKQQPNHVKLHLVDLKGGVELCDYENIKQTVSIAYEPEEAKEVLENAYNEMRKMQQRVRKLGKKNVQEAGIKERHFIIIDEVGELNPEEAVDREEKELKRECQRYMSQISRLGAGLGFRLILATQYPTGDVIPRQCKQNSDAKLCFRVQSSTASRVVLDGEGAEQLPEIKGRAIYQTADKKVIVQTPLITSEIIHSIIDPHIIDKGGQILEDPKQAPRSNPIIIEKTGLS